MPTHLLLFSPGGLDDFIARAAQGPYPLQPLPQGPEAAARLVTFLAPCASTFANLPPPASQAGAGQ
jgi:hypothetical protein